MIYTKTARPHALLVAALCICLFAMSGCGWLLVGIHEIATAKVVDVTDDPTGHNGYSVGQVYRFTQDVRLNEGYTPRGPKPLRVYSSQVRYFPDLDGGFWRLDAGTKVQITKFLRYDTLGPGGTYACATILDGDYKDLEIQFNCFCRKDALSEYLKLVGYSPKNALQQ